MSGCWLWEDILGIYSYPGTEKAVLLCNFSLMYEARPFSTSLWLLGRNVGCFRYVIHLFSVVWGC